MANPKPLFERLANLLGHHADQRAEELANRTLRSGNEYWSLGTDMRPHRGDLDFNEPYILNGNKNSVTGIPLERLMELERTRAPHERLWEMHTHPSGEILPSVQDLNFWAKQPGFAHGIIAPGESGARSVREPDMMQPGFGVWEAPSQFFSPRAMSQNELRARHAMMSRPEDVESIIRPHNDLGFSAADAADELAPYLGLDMWAKQAGPRVRYTREYPESPYLQTGPAVDELVDFFSKNNRFAAGGQVQPSGGPRLLAPPPFARDPMQESLRPQGPVGGANLSSLIAMARPEKPPVNPEGLDALLARLAAGAQTPAPAAPPRADAASPYDDYLAKLRVPDPAAVNPDTGATGAYDFIPSTFKSVVKQHFPDLAKLPDDQLTELMKDPGVSRAVATAFTQGNERTLAASGIPASDYTRYLAHWFGPAGAVDLLTGDDSRKMDDWFESYYPGAGTRWAKANALSGKTAAEALATARARMAPRR